MSLENVIKAAGHHVVKPQADDPQKPKHEDVDHASKRDDETQDQAESSAVKPSGDARSVRLDERSRIQAILTTPMAASNPGLAMALAFEGDYSAAEASKLLQASGPTVNQSPETNSADTLAAHIQAEQIPIIGADTNGTSQPEHLSALDAALDSRI